MLITVLAVFPESKTNANNATLRLRDFDNATMIVHLFEYTAGDKNNNINITIDELLTEYFNKGSTK